jgi:septal ring factor EnvC (AmiA/AmiB activator)
MLAALGSITRHMGFDIKYLSRLAAVTLAALSSGWGLAAERPHAQAAQTAEPHAAESPDSAEAKAKLAAVRGRIAALTNQLALELKQRDTLNAKLREADLSITTKRSRLESLKNEEQATERRRDELRAEETKTQNGLDAERSELASQVRAAYMIGQQGELRLLLSQGNPVEAGRMMTLYGYFARIRGEKIEEIDNQLTHLKVLVEEIDETAATLKSLESDASREMAELTRARSDRAIALASVQKQVASGNEALAELKRQEQAVEALVADLSRVLKDFPVDAQLNFDQLRGKLPWPVAGKLTARYQEARARQPGVRWNGVMIEAARGAKVRAPYFGRVVYADWLQGLGLLLIVAHSGNFMTLYGHAEVLYKSVGDWVSPGDVIASLSDTSGAAPQLYFEIREGRKTVDPNIWLKGGP